MRTTILISVVSLLSLGLTACEPEAQAEPEPSGEAGSEAPYENRLTGAIRFAEWSEPAAGLRCRLGAATPGSRRGGSGPVILLQVENVSDEPILTPDLFGGRMLVSDCPTNQTYTNQIFHWVFDGDRLRVPLQPSETVEAACRLPRRVLRELGAYALKVGISRGVYPAGTQGLPFRPGDWWVGSMTTPPLAMTLVK